MSYGSHFCELKVNDDDDHHIKLAFTDHPAKRHLSSEWVKALICDMNSRHEFNTLLDTKACSHKDV